MQEEKERCYLEEILDDDGESGGVICLALEVDVVDQHCLEDVQEELERVLVQEVHLVG